MGRTHGIHAEPDTFGHRVADLAFGMARCRDRLRTAREAVAVCKISGAVGTYSNIDPSIELEVASGLGLHPAPVATQVVLRDGIADWVAALAGLATMCEAFALEVRHGQRTEVRELSEPFGSGQKGSSAMPHKKNPIMSERIAGLARIVRAQYVPVLEGVPLWHERDISHSSTERIALPDAAAGTDYLLSLTTRLAEGLVVDEARMRANLDSTGGLIYTLAVLLALVESAGGFLRGRAVRRDGDLARGHPVPRDPAHSRRKGRAEAGRGRARRCLPARALRRTSQRRLRAAGGTLLTCDVSGDEINGKTARTGTERLHTWKTKILSS